eukprot:1916685-Rhodomonas_salina.1
MCESWGPAAWCEDWCGYLELGGDEADPSGERQDAVPEVESFGAQFRGLEADDLENTPSPRHIRASIVSKRTPMQRILRMLVVEVVVDRMVISAQAPS